MIDYYIHDGKKLLFVGTCGEADLPKIDASDGLFVVLEKLNLPQRPSMFHDFDIRSKKWIDQRTNHEKTQALRLEAIAERNRMLQASDWTQLPDVPLPTKEAWATYRQALRDIPAQAGFPVGVVWPAPPSN